KYVNSFKRPVESGSKEGRNMADKMTVTVPLTAKQKEQIRHATGRSISALKVGASGGLTAARATRIVAASGVKLAKVTSAKGIKLAKVTSAKGILTTKALS